LGRNADSACITARTSALSTPYRAWIVAPHNPWLDHCLGAVAGLAREHGAGAQWSDQQGQLVQPKRLLRAHRHALELITSLHAAGTGQAGVLPLDSLFRVTYLLFW